MTNLLVTVTMVLTTNWTTVSTTYPRCDMPGCAVLHYPMDNQVGALASNSVAIVVWKGTTNEVLLESIPLVGPKLERSILGEAVK